MSQRPGPEEPTEFGWFVIHRMAEQDPPLTQTELARRSGVSQSTIHRWLYKSGRPEVDKLKSFADVLGVNHGDLMAIAGHGRPTTDLTEAIAALRPPPLHPLAAEVDRMLGDRSPLDPPSRERLELLLDSLIDPYRRSTRRRRPSAG